jgi:autophagy-related protein 16
MSINHSEKIATVLELKNGTENLQSELMSTRREADALKCRLTECEEDVKEKAMEIQELKSVNQMLDTELKKSQENLDAMINKNANLERENAELINRILEQKEDQIKLMNELNSCYESIMKREEKIRQISNPADLDVRLASDFNFTDMHIRVPTKPLHKILAHSKEVNSVKYNDGGVLVVTGGADGLVKLYDALAGTEKSVLRGSAAAILDLDISPGSDMVIAGTVDSKALLWNLRTGRPIQTYTGHNSKVCSVCFFNNNSAVATASQDRSIRFWDVARGSCLRTLSCFSNVNSISLSHEDSILATGHFDGHIRIWSPRTGEQIKDIECHALPITSCYISESGNNLITCSKDNTLSVLDLRTYEVLGKLSHRDYITSSNFSKACWSTDSKYIVSGGSSGDVFLWDAVSLEISDILRSGHSSPVIACAWRPREGDFATVDSVGGLVIWG